MRCKVGRGLFLRADCNGGLRYHLASDYVAFIGIHGCISGLSVYHHSFTLVTQKCQLYLPMALLRIDPAHLDRLDIRILKELAQGEPFYPSRPGAKFSYRAVGKRLGISEGTVRNRLGAMSASGFLKGYKVFPNPNLLGLTMAGYGIDASSSASKREVVDRLKRIEDVVVVADYLSNYVGIVFVYATERSRQEKLALLNAAAGAESGDFTRILFPPCSVVLSQSDRRIIATLANDESRTYRDFAKEAGVSVRSFKRRLSRLLDAGAVFSQLSLRFGALEAVPANLMVSFQTPQRRGEAMHRIQEVVSDHTFYEGAWEEGGFYSLILPNPSIVRSLVEKVGKIPGVSKARIELLHERFDRLEDLGRQLGGQAAKGNAEASPIQRGNPELAR
ncbi:MAG: Lrp/AsnC family transcriptional regulator [Thaumarchaeota archaeon]|nr:Lrp/AsnC family transcriptional regulator [Nitrososphaerota archaeon]